MARLTLEERLAALEALRDDPHAPEAVEALWHALSLKSNYVIAKAASIIAEADVPNMTQPLIEAFERLMADPVKRDPGCGGKSAAAEALYRTATEADSAAVGERVFHPGVRHVQIEPVFGGSVDTAAELRGHCAFGLVRAMDPDVMLALADLLADREAPARATACRALAYSERPEALALLRYKATAGDEDVSVNIDALCGLLQLDAAGQLPLVVSRLRSGDEDTVTAAAMALGQSRVDQAATALIDFAGSNLDREARQTSLVALAMHRSETALNYLMEQITDAPAAFAEDAVNALAMYRHDPIITDRVRAAAAGREDTAIALAVRQQFAPQP